MVFIEGLFGCKEEEEKMKMENSLGSKVSTSTCSLSHPKWTDFKCILNPQERGGLKSLTFSHFEHGSCKGELSCSFLTFCLAGKHILTHSSMKSLQRIQQKTINILYSISWFAHNSYSGLWKCADKCIWAM